MLDARQLARRRPGAVVASGLALLAVLAGCGGFSTGGASDTGGDPVRGGRLVVEQPGDSGCIDPAQNQTLVILSMTRSFTDSLTYQDPASGEVRPWLAESWTANADASRYRFVLREGVTFSDGSPLTAGVVAANLDAIAAMGASSPVAGGYLAGYQGSTVVDERTVEVTFDRPSAPFLQATSTAPMGVVAESSARLSARERCTGKGLLGTGPFVLDRYTPSEGVAVSRRTGYAWAPEGVANRGDAYLDGIDFRLVTDSSVRTGSLVSGLSDLNGDAQTQDHAQLQAAGAVILADRPQPGLATSFFLNPRLVAAPASPLSDPAVRGALQAGLDREALAGTFVGAKIYPAATSAMTVSTPLYTDLAPELRFDPAAGTRLLDEAGWVRGPDGVRTRNGVRLSLELQYLTPIYLSMVPLMSLAQQELGELGIELRLQPVPLAEGQQRVAAGAYELQINGRTRADADAMSYLTGMSPALDAELAGQRSTLDPAERGRHAAAAQQIIVEQGLLFPIYDLVTPIALSPQVVGFTRDATNLWQFTSAWKRSS